MRRQTRSAGRPTLAAALHTDMLRRCSSTIGVARTGPLAVRSRALPSASGLLEDYESRTGVIAVIN